MSPRAYAIMHRVHHAYTDTEQDPHSPNFSSNLFSMMWRTRRIYIGIYDGTIQVEEKFTKNVPEWAAFDRFASSRLSRLLWIAAYVAFYIIFASPWLYPLLLIHFATGAFHGAIVNWFAHRHGYINFKLRNTSENLLPIDILMLGESYHNNHHKRPSAVNFGVRWHEIDPVYPVILFLNRLRIIKLPKLAAVPAV